MNNINQLIEERIKTFKEKVSITERNNLILSGSYSMTHRYKIKDVISIFVDIRGSTALSASSSHHDSTTAAIYEFFTGTAVKLFHQMGAEYIDIKGDGVFALYSKENIHKSFAAAVTFKTFAQYNFLPQVEQKLSKEIDIGYHMGIDQKTVLVKQIGIKEKDGQDKRKNEVWAGKPINMSAKLASLSQDGELLISDRYYKNLSKNDMIQKTCGCENGKETDNFIDIWTETRDVSDDHRFDFNTIYVLKSTWCNRHGKEFCEAIIKLDDE